MRALLASSKQNRPEKLLPPRKHALLYSFPNFLRLSVDAVIHVGAICNMRGRLVGVSVPPSTPQLASPKKINHTEISISYKVDWPIRSGYLLALITFVSPLSLTTLATRLSIFLSWEGYILPLQWSAQE